MNKKSKEINEQIEYGLDSINPDETIELKLKDFMLIFKTFEELNRFFHQPMLYPTLEDVQIFLGNVDFGAYSMISKIYYKVMSDYIPKEIEERFDEEDNPFENPNYPYYYKVKNDENIDDGTLQIEDKQSFVEFVKKLSEEKELTPKVKDFLETISRYAEDIDGYYKNMGFETSADMPTWRIFAQILKGATVFR